MTRRLHPVTRGVTLLLGASLVVACSGDDTGPDSPTPPEALVALLLDEQQVAGTASARLVEHLPRTELCNNLASSETGAETFTGEDRAVRELVVPRAEGEVVVETAVYSRTAPALLESLAMFVGTCSDVDPARPLGSDSRNGVFTPLQGLPDGASGYQVTYGGADVSTSEQRSRAYAQVGRSLVVVGARATGVPLDVSVPDLLQAAVTRAAEAGEPA